MEYFQGARPDIVPVSTLSSVAGMLTTPPPSQPSPHEDTPPAAPSTTHLPTRSKQRATASGFIAAIEKNRTDRREAEQRTEERRARNEDLRTQALLKLVEGSPAQPSQPQATTKEQRHMIAEDHLGKLETSDDLAGRADIKVVLRKVRECLYGPDPARAAATVARLYALASRNASDEVCALRLSELSWDEV